MGQKEPTRFTGRRFSLFLMGPRGRGHSATLHLLAERLQELAGQSVTFPFSSAGRPWRRPSVERPAGINRKYLNWQSKQVYGLISLNIHL